MSAAGLQREGAAHFNLSRVRMELDEPGCALARFAAER